MANTGSSRIVKHLPLFFFFFFKKTKNNNNDLIMTSVRNALNKKKISACTCNSFMLVKIKANKQQQKSVLCSVSITGLDAQTVLESHRCLHSSGTGWFQWHTKILLRGIADFNWCGHITVIGTPQCCLSFCLCRHRWGWFYFSNSSLISHLGVFLGPQRLSVST